MGQQQLLLLILGIVIVGLAVVVGINAFSEGQVKSAGDALVAEGLRIASDVQAWALKPAQAGGGGSADAMRSLIYLRGFEKLGYPTVDETADTYVTPNGTFRLTLCEVNIPSGKELLICVYGDNQAYVDGQWVGSSDVKVYIGIAGTNADDIGTLVLYHLPEEPPPTF